MDRDGRVDWSTVPWVSALANGAVTYVAGFLVSLLLGTSLFSLMASLGVSSIPFGTQIAMTFYGAHFVPASFGDGTTINLALSPFGPGLVSTLAVAGLLVASGYYVAGKPPVRSLEESVAAGAALALGYLPLVAAGAVYFGATVTSTGTFGETRTVVVSFPLARTLLLAGVAFPLAFGALGGVLRFYRSDGGS